MVLESTMICVDNSDFMRNGDFVPTRLQAQQDAVDLVCRAKMRSNPENDVGLIIMAKVEVLVTLTNDVGKIFSKLHRIIPNGNINLPTGIRVAQLALKHRQGKNHKMRIVAFVGSPIMAEEKELLNLAKKLKKEKVNVDIVSFGEEALNTEVLTSFIYTLNGKDGTGSHLLTIPPGPDLATALITSPVIQGEDASFGVAGFEFGVDADEDPELALALRISMEEERRRQEEEARRLRAKDRIKVASIEEEPNEETLAIVANEGNDDGATAAPNSVHFADMTEEEQIAFAIKMSTQDGPESSKSKKRKLPKDVDAGSDQSEDVRPPKDKKKDEKKKKRKK